jgi:hypothetical protein
VTLTRKKTEIKIMGGYFEKHREGLQLLSDDFL